MSSGSISYWKDERDTFDNVHTTYEYPNDIQASFGSNRACTYERPYLKIYGDKATIEVNFRGKNTAQITPNPSIAEGKDAVDAISSASYKLFDKSDKKNIIVEDEVYSSYNNIMYSFYSDTLFGYKHFIDMIVNDALSDISVTDGKKTAISVLMANLSNRNNTVEFWKPEYGV